MTIPLGDQARTTACKRPRLGFLGVGWIGRHRMKALLDSGIAEAAVIAEPSPECQDEAAKLAPAAQRMETLEDLLAAEVDGIVIATPSANHAEQAIAALGHGIPVFCQKPLGRSSEEANAVIAAARAADRLLGLDLSYRHTEAMRRIRPIVAEGGIGRIHAVDLVFHNAYGPDKPWFYDPALSGGGCVIDLGVHLVDLALWTLGFPAVTRVESHLFNAGEPLPPNPDIVEDFAVATLTLETGTVVRLTCSWRLHAGQDAMISAAFYGTEGGAALSNVDGSFYDFVAERFDGTARTRLAAPPDDWGGRAAVAWATRLATNNRYDPQAEQFATVAEILDRIYGRSPQES
ncbi:Gfo/Idh/MocA family oxidoreductase [Chelativorans sp. M5D2P16]|uniref:Gfo/Idh/MocA family protein n=1 Tax=Chelativorans sp. M5D2P16 TaxID=3095678 RepID=UPI002AC9FF49|nr:Gfo/Idh/MocA family oxidoreductase [Chelativorans sp. M5D2P16]MDZ5699040.1 Gfo/Idh/MocA family oxidoreductase [Chelativorans sp. M5D2P16]